MIKFLSMAFLLLLPAVSFAMKPLKICVDNRYWYPFVYQESNKAKGIFIEMAKTALMKNGIKAEFVVMPIKRCINILGPSGKVDAVIGIPYDKKLNKSLYYPTDADLPSPSQWRLMQVDFNLVTAKDNPFDFTGELTNIPQPIRIPYAYSNIIDKINQQGIEIETSKQDESTFYKLLRNNKGSLITTSILTDRFDDSARFRNKFTVHPIPIASLSYFLVFFNSAMVNSAMDNSDSDIINSARVNAELRQKVWSDITALRDDYIYMLQLLSMY